VSGQPVFVIFPENDYLEQKRDLFALHWARKGFQHPVAEWVFINADFDRHNSSLLQQVRTRFASGEITRRRRTGIFYGYVFPVMDEEIIP